MCFAEINFCSHKSRHACLLCSLTPQPDNVDPVSSLKGTITGMAGNQAKSSIVHPSIHSDQVLGGANSGLRMPSLLKENRDVKPEMNINLSIPLEGTVRWSQQNVFPVVKDPKKGAKRTQNDCSDQDVQRMKSINVFQGKTFCFSESFPEDRVTS